MISVNLIPRARRDAAARRARTRAWSILCSVYAGLLILGCLAFRLPSGAEAQQIQTDSERTAARIQQAEDDKKKVLTEHEHDSRLLEATKAVRNHPDWSILLNAIAQVRDQDVVLERVDVAPQSAPAATTPPGAKPAKPAPAAKSADGKDKASPPPPRREAYTIKVSGIAQNQNAVAAFVTRLENLHVFDSVVRGQSRSQNYRGLSATWFEIECTIAEKAVTPPARKPGQGGEPAAKGAANP